MIPSARRHLRTEGVRLCNFCIDSSSTPKTSSRSWGETRKHAHSSRPCWRPFSRGLGRWELEHTDDGSQVGATWQGRYLKQGVANMAQQVLEPVCWTDCTGGGCVSSSARAKERSTSQQPGCGDG